MESQLQHTHGHHYDDDSLTTAHHTGYGHNEDEHHGEKKSVIKKVKEKAKKIKNTITKHGHGHHHHDEEDDDEEETVQDPKVHGAPMYDSSRGSPDVNLTEARGNMERPSVLAEDRYSKPVSSHGVAPHNNNNEAYGQEVNPRGKIGQSVGMEAPRMASPIGVTDHTPPYGTRPESAFSLGDVNQGVLRGIVGKGVPDPNAPRDPLSMGLDPSNYGTKLDKASAAKDAIASKIGYSDQTPTTQSHESINNQGSATDYAHKITDKVTEMLAPVYEKVMDAGSSVISKMQGSMSGTGQRQGSETSTLEKENVTDKGVSVKEHLVETLRPGEDDKALSNVITHALHSEKQEVSEKKAGEDRPMGIVTESVEVQRRLGTDRREEHRDDSGNVVVEKNMSDRLIDAMGSWFGGKGDAPQGTLGTSYVTDEGLSSSPTGHKNKGRKR